LEKKSGGKSKGSLLLILGCDKFHRVPRGDRASHEQLTESSVTRLNDEEV